MFCVGWNFSKSVSVTSRLLERWEYTLMASFVHAQLNLLFHHPLPVKLLTRWAISLSKQIERYLSRIFLITKALLWLFSMQSTNLYIPSTLNIDLILWHTQLIVCAENVKSWFKSRGFPLTFQAYILPHTLNCMCVSFQLFGALYMYISEPYVNYIHIKVPLFCWFYHFLYSRAEICHIFVSFLENSRHQKSILD